MVWSDALSPPETEEADSVTQTEMLNIAVLSVIQGIMYGWMTFEKVSPYCDKSTQ